MALNATSKAKSMTVEAVVIRADGTVENLGVVGRWHRNPIRRLMWRIQTTLSTHRRS